ncbi:MAG: hypothetical protein HQL18_04550 [Candidatus Omnitrophica bacterium]|nr:hypothetical protein [Candidatus Omnitrophota bacterium]
MKKIFWSAALVLCFAFPVRAEGTHEESSMDVLLNDAGMEMPRMHLEKKMNHGPQMRCSPASMVATSDGGVIVLSAGKLRKFDRDLNLIKEVQIDPAAPEGMNMMMSDKMCPIMGRMKTEASTSQK